MASFMSRWQLLRGMVCIPLIVTGSDNSIAFFRNSENEENVYLYLKFIIITLYIEFIDSTGLNYIMFSHNSVVLRN